MREGATEMQEDDRGDEPGRDDQTLQRGDARSSCRHGGGRQPEWNPERQLGHGQREKHTRAAIRAVPLPHEDADDDGNDGGRAFGGIETEAVEHGFYNVTRT